MKFAVFKGETIHALAEDNLTPLCHQTDAHKARNLQIIAFAKAPTCQRCLKLLDKNGPAARTRRRFAAARQALRDGRAGVEQFEKRTTDPVARERCSAVVREVVADLIELADALQIPNAIAPMPRHSTTPTTQPT